MRIIVSFVILLTSCNVWKENESNKKTEGDSIIFLVLNIYRDSVGTNSVVELVSKTVTDGKIKNGNKNKIQFENYLSIDVYQGKTITDQMTIEHPLYKHFEYVNDSNSFTAIDTVLNHAAFFLRIHTSGNLNKIRVSETLKDKAKKELTVIKL
jgi:hypothetical protein